MSRWILPPLVLLLLVVDARAGSAEPPSMTTAGEKTLFLRGTGVHRATWLNIDVYHAALYVEDRSCPGAEVLDGDQDIQLRLRFDRSVSRKDLARAAEKGIRRQLGYTGDAYRDQLDQLRRWFRPVRRGELLELTFDKGVGVELCWNGRDCRRIGGNEFARALFATWLGARPLSQRLKADLLQAH